MKYGAAAQKDLPQMVELLGRLFEQEAEFSANASKQEAALNMLLADPKAGRLYVAKDGAKVTALARVMYTNSTA
jgi:hypothetical protein